MGTTQVIRAFLHAKAKAGSPPSIAEVADELGVAASTARERMNELVENGLLRKVEGRQRGYELTEAGLRIAGSV